MHYPAHGHTAAEIIYRRANAEETFMGMTAFEGKKPKKIRCLYRQELFKRRGPDKADVPE